MATEFITMDQTVLYNVDNGDDIILLDGVTMTSTGDIFGTAGNADFSLTLNGTIYASDDIAEGTLGVFTVEDPLTINIGASAQLFSLDDGFVFGAAGGEELNLILNHAGTSQMEEVFLFTSTGLIANVVNTGTIMTSGDSGGQAQSAFDLSHTATITNSGTISTAFTTYTGFTSTTVATIQSDDDLTVNNSGDILSGNGVAIASFIFSGETFDLTNSGYIEGDIYGGDNSASIDTVINSGRVDGNITLNDGDDTYDGRGGSVQGTIDGGEGADILDVRNGFVAGEVLGGLGDDIYYVSDADTALVENASEGTDRVFSEADVFILGENFENLTLIGGDTDGIGNSDSNNILGSIGDNVIRGNDGLDTVNGGGGDDIVYGNGGGDEVRGGGGRDVLRGGSEGDNLIAGSGADQLFGGEGVDELFGGNGRDMLKGGLGRDTMTGGDGADTFVFDRVNESVNSDSDRILDFTSGEDAIDLSGMAAQLTFVGGAAFSGTGAEVRVTVSGSGDTLVRVDADGNGTTDMKIVLEGLATGIEAYDLIL